MYNRLLDTHIYIYIYKAILFLYSYNIAAFAVKSARFAVYCVHPRFVRRRLQRSLGNDPRT